MSFDVGIKNLAYCILEINDDRFKIINWGVLDLADDRIICSFKTECKNIAKFIIDGTNYCSTHIKKHKFEKIEYAENNYKCNKKKCMNKIGYSYVDNGTCYGWCEDHKKDEEKWEKKKIKKVSQNVNKMSLKKLNISMYEKLNEMNLIDLDKVLIENQPTFINPTMKTISAFLFSYFVMKGIELKKDIDVVFCSPSNKLKAGGIKAENIVEGSKNVYKMTKKMGVTLCKALVDPEMVEHLNNHIKKDDLADAFLQAFINIFPKIPPHYNEMIEAIDFNQLQ